MNKNELFDLVDFLQSQGYNEDVVYDNIKWIPLKDYLGEFFMEWSINPNPILDGRFIFIWLADMDELTDFEILLKKNFPTLSFNVASSLSDYRKVVLINIEK